MDKMLSEGLASLLIVDDQNQLVGRIEESMLMSAAFDPQWRTSSTVCLHMQRDYVALRPDEPVVQAIEKFLEYGVSEFPVLRDEKLVGVLTRRQLLRAVLSHGGSCTTMLAKLSSSY